MHLFSQILLFLRLLVFFSTILSSVLLILLQSSFCDFKMHFILYYSSDFKMKKI